MSTTTNFKTDLKKGKINESRFIKIFLEYHNLSFKDVTNDPVYQKMDVDIVLFNGTKYEVKTYHDNGILYVEDYSNYNIKLAPKTPGWVIRSRADYFAFVSQKYKKIILLKNGEKFRLRLKQLYLNKQVFRKLNKVSINNGKYWQSSFIPVPYLAFKELIQIIEIPEGNSMQTELL